MRRLAEDVESRGVRLFEQSPVTRIEPGRVVTADGTVRAETILRATEGYTPTLAGENRTVVPIYSLVLATEPLPASTWAEIGLARRETFSDYRHLIIYGQRTDDDRFVFGGRGRAVPLRARAPSPAYDREPRVFGDLRKTLVDLLPGQWPRLGSPTRGEGRSASRATGAHRSGSTVRTGIGWAGGYVGDGVSTTNLAGRTLRDLVLGRDTDLTRLPWVGHRSKRWEPEPLRWLGINAGLRAMTVADAEERLTRRPSLIAKAMAPLIGGH